MPGQILVPLDGSSFGEQALPLALAVARRAQGEVHLVKVHVPPPPPTKGVFDGRVDGAATETETRYLRALAELVGALHGVTTHTALLAGDVIAGLDAYVRDHGITTVVMTSHGRGGLSRAWLGSIADALVRHVDVPVLIVRPNGGSQPTDADAVRLDHILVPLDGSTLSEGAVGQAVAFGAAFHARYTLLQVMAPPIALAGAPDAPVAWIEQDLEPLREAGLQYLEGVAAPLRARGIHVDTAVVMQSQSAPGILEEAAAREADMIVMATHGRGGYRRVALGSVADKVLRGATIPVLMFRAKPGVPAPDLSALQEAFI
jgi:nucleotide-binding universal stress UspA family protein